MLETYVRPLYQSCFIGPVLKVLPRWINPLHITVLAGFFGLAAAVLIVIGLPYLAITSLLASGYCDTLDGSLARAKSMSSPIGSMADILCDRVVEFSVVFGLYLAEPASRGIPCFVMLGSVLLCVTVFLVVGIFAAKEGEKSFHYNPGLIERAEAFLFFIAMILFPSSFNSLAWIFSVLVCLTTFLHIRTFLRHQDTLQNSPNLL